MALTAEDVVERVFKQEFRGYDREEVDTFLDDVADRISELMREQERLTAELAAAREQGAGPAAAPERPLPAERPVPEHRPPPTPAVRQTVPAPPPQPAAFPEGGEGFEALLKRTLVAAQRTADQTVEEARAEAERILADAREEAEEERAEAERRTEEYVGSTRRRIEAEREESRAGVERIRRAVEELERFRREYRERVREVLTGALAQLDRGEELPEVSPRLAELDRFAQAEQARLPRGAEVRPVPVRAGARPATPGRGPWAPSADDAGDTDEMEAARVEQARRELGGAPETGGQEPAGQEGAAPAAGSAEATRRLDPVDGETSG